MHKKGKYQRMNRKASVLALSWRNRQLTRSVAIYLQLAVDFVHFELPCWNRKHDHTHRVRN